MCYRKLYAVNVYLPRERLKIQYYPGYNNDAEAVVRICSAKKVLLNILQNSQENACVRVFFFNRARPAILLKRETLAQVFSSEFCEIYKNIFFMEHLWQLLLVMLYIIVTMVIVVIKRQVKGPLLFQKAYTCISIYGCMYVQTHYVQYFALEKPS